MAELTAVKTLYKPKNIEESIAAFLKENDLNTDDIHLFLTGKNGDTRNDQVYNQLSNSLFQNTALANYKHLCGEYPTSTSFALWLAANMVKNGVVPEIVSDAKGLAPKKVLIYNHYQNKYHSLMLVSSV